MLARNPETGVQTHACAGDTCSRLTSTRSRRMGVLIDDGGAGQACHRYLLSHPFWLDCYPAPVHGCSIPNDEHWLCGVQAWSVSSTQAVQTTWRRRFERLPPRQTPLPNSGFSRYSGSITFATGLRQRQCSRDYIR